MFDFNEICNDISSSRICNEVCYNTDFSSHLCAKAGLKAGILFPWAVEYPVPSVISLLLSYSYHLRFVVYHVIDSGHRIMVVELQFVNIENNLEFVETE